MKTTEQESKTGQRTLVSGHLLARRSAFTLVEIMIVVAIIGILTSIAIPAWAKSRNHARTTVCLTNLRQIFYAKAQWALTEHHADTETPTGPQVSPYIQGEVMPLCPAGGTYDLNAVATAPTCTLAVEGHTL